MEANGTADEDAAWIGKPCPKCAYVRLPSDGIPAWQCPRCHVAYLQHQTDAAPTGARLAAEGREMAAEAKSDGSLVMLLGANLVALFFAYYSGMGLRDLMLVYWIQSVVIGVSNVVRILNLERFDTTNLTMRGRPVEETVASKRKVALFFLVH